MDARLTGTVPRRLATLVLLALSPVCGCSLLSDEDELTSEHDRVHYKYASTQIAEPNLLEPRDDVAATTPPPNTLDADAPREYQDVTLQEVTQTALRNSRILKDLGGTILRSPVAQQTVFDPALQETDPRFGVEAALSAFDASFATSAFFEKNDRALNNVFFGGGTRILEQDAYVIQSQIAKRAVTGTEFAIRNDTDYDANNAPGNNFGSAWNFNMEAVARHPLLQGGGVEFNRIAGPSDTPGLYNGVLVARINTDVALADFQMGLRDFVSDVENAYWDLYFAYRELDARIQARDEALETWRTINAWKAAGRKGGEASNEAQAREQYYRFEEQVQNAFAGVLLDGTQTNNGSPGGTFRGTAGLLVAERRLRRLMGLPVSGEKLLRPADTPPQVNVVFDWDEVLSEALSRRSELRRQKWQVKRRQLELQASKNFLLPDFDAVGRYRWRGFGKDLYTQHDVVETISGTPAPRFNSALQNLADGDFQEWQLGFELTVPLGYRRAHVAVRNAELQLARERAILHEQEQEIAKNLSDAVADLSRAYAVMKTNYNRMLAARTQFAALEAKYQEEQLTNETLLVIQEAQRRKSEAETAYHRASVEYALAIKNVHFEKGSLLGYNEILLEEGLSPAKAYLDAQERFDLRSDPIDLPLMQSPRPVSAGPAPQLVRGATPSAPNERGTDTGNGDETGTQSERGIPSRDASPVPPPAPKASEEP